MNGTSHVLMDGVVTNHQILPGSDAGHATLSITGEDLSVLMDKIDFSGFPFPATPAEGRVALLLLKYAFLGIVPLVVPSILIDIPIPTTRIPFQQGTDLSYIRSLAARVGYVFYVEPGPVPGLNIAYWGPQIKVGVPQPALNINMDAHTNVESLSFSFNNNLNAIPTVFYYDELSKVPIPIPIPPITPLQPAARTDSADSDPAAAGQRRPVEAVAAAGDHDRPREGGAADRRGVGQGAARRAALRTRSSRRGNWSACAAPARRTTASTTSRASRTRSSAASTSRASS